MKITKKELEKLLEYRNLADELSDRTLINLLINKRFDEIKYLNEKLKEDTLYIRHTSDAYRDQKDDARSRLPMYRQQIKENNDFRAFPLHHKERQRLCH